MNRIPEEEPEGFIGLTPGPSSAVAEWLVSALTPVQNDPHNSSPLRWIVPDCFSACARILHTAYRQAGLGAPLEPIRWAEIAERTGQSMHSEIEWEVLVEPTLQTRQWPSYVAHGGCMDAHQADALSEILARFTSSSDDCCFGLWEGYEDFPRGCDVPQLVIPDRTYWLLLGRLEGVREYGRDAWPRLPDLWWPADRSWYVASDTDSYDTYVAGSAECVQAVLSDERIEAFDVTGLLHENGG